MMQSTALKFTFLGTGSSSQVPVYNCFCPACQRARWDKAFRRRPCSAMIETSAGKWLIDSGLTDLTERFFAYELKGILQTHYHADHAQGLLQLRWGVDATIPVYGPVDEVGFADLYKHPGILDFQPGFTPFEVKRLGDSYGFSVMALPLQHSRPTVGYLISSLNGESLAYLTDTAGLSAEVMQFLSSIPLRYVVLDCSYPPSDLSPQHDAITKYQPQCDSSTDALDGHDVGMRNQSVQQSHSKTSGAHSAKSRNQTNQDEPQGEGLLSQKDDTIKQKTKNHNDLWAALDILEQLSPEKGFLTHIDHKVDTYIMQNPHVLPENVALAQDNLSLVLR
ncbi:MBL fold metallo-hydrolase [Pelistega europaea]|uniref:Metallo-beta-lactamase domain-containing protein n=1 Tax=Pelistega europaea TaxID=106147 RepID=A0A7Y4L9J1_9BURK|nr:MBL fold metallo-hydrolase [Pelistega europaea]NOL49373.1 hypothetical protein [Pelistega europaea]